MENKEGRSATNYPIYEEDKYNYDKQRQIHNTMNHGYPLNNQQVMFVQNPMQFHRIQNLSGLRESTKINCYQCNKLINTKTKVSVSLFQWIACVVVCIFGCVPFCFIPFYFPNCYKRTHYCPDCGIYLGASDP